MSMHDIELPPLPVPRTKTDGGIELFAEYSVREYARAAIEPYKQRISELEAQLEAIGAGGVSSQPITSQRGGEPVAFAKDGNLFWRGDPVAWREFSGGLYLAPQPAEPVKVPSKLSNAEIMSLAYDVGAMPEQMTDGSLLTFARALLARYGQSAPKFGEEE